MKKALGTHLILEFYGCDPGTLKEVPYVEEAFLRAAKESKTHVVTHSFHQFKPYGVSGVVVIEESHYSIHTWPEYAYAAIDLFYCSDEIDIDKAIEVLKKAFKPTMVKTTELLRGKPSDLAPFLEKSEVASGIG